MKNLITIIAILFASVVLSQNTYSIHCDTTWGENGPVMGFSNGSINTALSVAFWAKPDSINNPAPQHLLRNNVWGQINAGGLGITYSKYGQGKLTVEEKSINSGNQFEFTSIDSIDDGNWHFITLTRGAASPLIVKLYIDGNLQDTVAAILAYDDIDFDNWHIGNTYKPDKYYFGLIDEFSLWTKVLTESEINNIMNCPPTGIENGLFEIFHLNDGTGIYSTGTVDVTNSFIFGYTWSTDVPPDTCLTTNINEHASSEINIYPNPASNILNIDIGDNNSIQIFDLFGKLIYKTDKSEIITTAIFPNFGMYLIQIFNDNNKLIKTKKLIIN